MSDMEVSMSERCTRDKAVKRWTNNETNLLLDYIQYSLPFEQPSARLYYLNFLDSSNIQTTWSSVRWKVRNLRLSFKKANGLLRQNAQNQMNSGKVDHKELDTKLIAKLDRICPHYHRLEQIFGNKLENDAEDKAIIKDDTSLFNSVMTDCNTSNFNNADKDIRFPMSPPLTNGFTDQDSMYNKILEPAINVEVANNKTGSCIGIDEIKIKLEEERLNKEYQIQEKKLKLEELKIHNDFELRKMEIEMNERLARYELDLKYSSHHS